MKTLLVDLTSLSAVPSQSRGLGRYLRELANGLAALPESALGSLRLLGLTDLKWDGSYRVTSDLASAAAVTDPSQYGPRDYYRWAYTRRVALWRALRELRADAVHLGDPHSTPLLMGLTSCLKVVTCHDLIPLRYPQRYLGWKDGGPMIGRAIEKRRYVTADRVIAISDTTRDDLCSLLGMAQERIVRVYNAVDLERWSLPALPSDGDVAVRLGLSARPYVLYVGGCDWHKNIEGTVRGFAAACAQGADIDLAWAGKLSQEQMARVTELCRAERVEDRVRFLGFVDDAELRVLYRHALAHLLLSHAEGFGLTVVEAMASGCPVVTTTGGSLGEIVGDAALKVAETDSDAAGAALVRLSREPQVRAECVRRGLERAPLFSRETQARAMVAAFRDVLAI